MSTVPPVPPPPLSPPASVRTEEIMLNMGPQHPSTHGVLRVLLRSDGEIILDSECHIGYLHRCFEKIAEKVSWLQVVPYTDRLDYLCAMGNNLGYCLAVEKLMDLQVPERAEYIRIIAMEINRIASHLLAVGTYGLDVGAITPFFYAFRDREKAIRLLEQICGQRLNYSYIRIGGVAYDVPSDWIPRVREFCDYFLPKVEEFNRLLTYNGIFIRRAGGVAILPTRTAIDYGVTGPNLRACGIARDVRRDQPYSIYDRFDFDVITGTGRFGGPGDCFDRYDVRVREMIESVKIIRQACDQFPAEGEHMHPKIKKVIRPPAGEAYSKIENARGELGFYIVSSGGTEPYRCKCRAPSFSNISILPTLSRGLMVADLVATIGSLDIVMGEIDK